MNVAVPIVTEFRSSVKEPLEDTAALPRLPVSDTLLLITIDAVTVVVVKLLKSADRVD